MKTVDIGNHIRYYRRLRQLSQSDLAKTAGISRTSIQRLEAGEDGTSLGVLLKICDILNCKIRLLPPENH
jgi:DNA-binding XRE family transcriptional regulator